MISLLQLLLAQGQLSSTIWQGWLPYPASLPLLMLLTGIQWSLKEGCKRSGSFAPVQLWEVCEKAAS